MTVEGVVAQVAKAAGPVNLGRQQVHAGHRMGFAAIDTGFFAPFDHGQDIADEFLLVERTEGSQEPSGFVASGGVGSGERPFHASRLGDFGDNLILCFFGPVVGLPLPFAPRLAISY